MRIAIASQDGFGVAGSAHRASTVLVFPVSGDEVGEPELRSLAEERQSAEPGSPQRKPAEHVVDLVLFPESPWEEDSEADSELSRGFLRAVADCDILVARAFSGRAQAQCAQLGILALAAAVPGNAREVIRFVVSGRTPQHGSGCAVCPGGSSKSGLLAVPARLIGG